MCTLGVVAIYSGDYDSSRQWCRALLAVAELPLARHVDGHATLALIASYDGEIAEADRHAARAMAIAEATGSTPYLAMARYAQAAVAAAADRAMGVPLLVTAVHQADKAGADFLGGLAAGALAATLTRLNRTGDALDVLDPLLERWLRLAAWPQLWTALRILAELLAQNERPEEAALLLAAADRAPSAPALAGTDTARYVQLAEMLRKRLSPATYEKITILASLLPRTVVVDRARAAITDLRADATAH